MIRKTKYAILIIFILAAVLSPGTDVVSQALMAGPAGSVAERGDPPRVAVIGAGPAGLAAAFELLERTDVHPVVLEASHLMGGIARTVEHLVVRERARTAGTRSAASACRNPPRG